MEETTVKKTWSRRSKNPGKPTGKPRKGYFEKRASDDEERKLNLNS